VSSPAFTTSLPGLDGRTVLEEWGDTALARAALFPGYRYFLGSDGRVVVPWQARLGCALALGAPSGPGAAHASAVAAFAAFARRRGLVPAFVPVPAESGGDLKDAGFHLLHVGDEARLDLEQFSLEGGRRKSLRQSAARGEREGIWVQSWPGHLPPSMLHALRATSRAWLRGKRLPERRFGAGWWEPDSLARTEFVVARSLRRRAEAFVTLVGGYRPGELAVDLMRVRPDAPAGTMDLLLARTAELAADRGAAVLNLGLAPLAGVGSRPGASTLERILGRVARGFEGYYDFSGLRAFKEKFRPEWKPRYLAYPSFRTLPRLLVALTELTPATAVRAAFAGARRSS